MIALVAAGYLLAWGLFYLSYLRARPAAHIRLAATLDPTLAVAQMPKLLLRSARHADSSLSIRTANVQAVDVALSSRTEFSVPVRRDACVTIRPRSLSTCRNGLLKLATPIALAWKDRAQPLQLTRTKATRITLALRQGSEGTLAIGVGSEGAGALRACFGSAQSDTFSVTSVEAIHSWSIASDTAQLCGQGLQIVPQHVQSSPGLDALLLRNVLTLDATAATRMLQLEGRNSGFLYTSATHPFANDSVLISGRSPFQIQLRQEQGQRQVSLTIPSFSASTARIAGQEILPTNFQRSRWWLTSGFFGGAGLIWVLIQIGEYLRKQIGEHPRKRGEVKQ